MTTPTSSLPSLSSLQHTQSSTIALKNETIIFRTCNFGGKTWQHILDALPSSGTVHHIVINDSPLDDEQFAGLTTTARLVKDLMSFFYQNNRLRADADINGICGLIKCAPMLENLQIEGCSITNAMVRILVQALPFERLKRLSLCRNCITDEGAYELALCLDKCTSLRILDLSENHIGNAGLQGIARGLKNHRAPLQIKLEGNSEELTATGVKDLIVHVPALKELDVSFHPKLPAATIIKHALKRSVGLKRIKLQATKFTEDDAQKLVNRKRQRKEEAPPLHVDIQIDQITKTNRLALQESNLGAIFHQFVLKDAKQ